MIDTDSFFISNLSWILNIHTFCKYQNFMSIIYIFILAHKFALKMKRNVQPVLQTWNKCVACALNKQFYTNKSRGCLWSLIPVVLEQSIMVISDFPHHTVYTIWSLLFRPVARGPFQQPRGVKKCKRCASGSEAVTITAHKEQPAMYFPVKQYRWTVLWVTSCFCLELLFQENTAKMGQF